MPTASQILIGSFASNLIVLALALYFVHTRKHFLGGLAFIFLGISISAIEIGVPGMGDYLFAPVWIVWVVGIYYCLRGILEGTIA